MSRKTFISVICVIFFTLIYLNLSLVNNNSSYQLTNNKFPKPILKTYSSNNTIWVSMGLCYDQNAKILGKNEYPYAEVTPMAIRLWKHFRPDVKIYIKLIYSK